MRCFLGTFCFCQILLAWPRALAATGETDFQTSQQFLVRAWQTDDGLPQNWVSCVVQTPDGYIWIGTRYGGLARFDGRRFVAFNPENTPELRDVQVEYADVDEHGALWVMMGNESVTRVVNGQFQLMREPRAQPRLRPQSVLQSDANSVLFIEEGARLARLSLTPSFAWEVLSPNPEVSGLGQAFWRDQAGVVWYLAGAGNLGRFWKGNFTTNGKDLSLPKTPFTSLSADAQNHLWLTTSNRVFCRRGEEFEDETPTNGPGAANISDLAASSAGCFWVRDGNRLLRSSNRRWTVDTRLRGSIQRDNTARKQQLFSDAEGNAWLIDYGHGLWCVKADGEVFEFKENNGLPNGFITCWFQDRENNVWVGTVGGIACISKRSAQLLSATEGMPGKIARSVCWDRQGTLWVGTMSGGVAYWQSNHFVRVELPMVNALSPLESVTVCPDSDGSLWLGTLRHGLMRLQDGHIGRPLATSELPSVRILFEDSQDRLWIGGLADLRCYQQGSFRLFGTSEGFQSGIAIGAMAEDPKGVIWIGTGPGDLWKFQDGKFSRFPLPPEWPSFRFAALQADSDGSVWAGTLGGGLVRFSNGHFTRFTGQQGLPNLYVSQLREDKQGNLWAGTYAGILRLSKTNLNAVADGKEGQLRCRVYGRSSGLAALECTSGFQPSCWTSSDGRLWFCTAAGLAAIDPDSQTSSADPLPPPVVIEELLVDGMPRAILPAGDTASPRNSAPQLNIEPGRHFVQFRYTGLSLAAPDEVSFRVKLEGAENQWRQVGYQRTIGYGPLAPGPYRFGVTACSSGGLWNERGALLSFRVLPFFWQTWWFKGGLLAAIVLGSGSFLAFTLTRKHRLDLQTLRAQHELDRERTRISQDLHDSLGTNLTQINMLSALADRETANEEVKSLNQQIRHGVREMVGALDEIVWAANPRNDSAAELVNYCANFASEFFRAACVSCRLDIPSQLPVHFLSAETRHHLFLVFKETINNAARHSQAAHVWISVAATPNELAISIKDDGCGFDSSHPNFKAGDGLSNICSRMERLGGRAQIQSSPGLGTAITLYIPLHD